MESFDFDKLVHFEMTLTSNCLYAHILLDKEYSLEGLSLQILSLYILQKAIILSHVSYNF